MCYRIDYHSYLCLSTSSDKSGAVDNSNKVCHWHQKKFISNGDSKLGSSLASLKSLRALSHNGDPQSWIRQPKGQIDHRVVHSKYTNSATSPRQSQVESTRSLERYMLQITKVCESNHYI